MLVFFVMRRRPPGATRTYTRFPYTTLCRASGLGLLRAKEVGKPRLLKSLAAHYMPQSGAVDALILTKTNARSTVHRPGYMDYIGVLKFDDKGKPTGEERLDRKSTRLNSSH